MSSAASSSAPASTPAVAPKAPEEAQQPVVELLEDDDEFQEFDEEDWTPKAQGDKEEKNWTDDWDDDLADENFISHLREELKIK